MTTHGIKQMVYKPRVVIARHPVGPNPHPARVILEYFTCPARKGNSCLILPALREFLEGLSFEIDWVDRFVYAADEALSNACERATPDTTVRCLLTVIESGRERFVTLFVDNDFASSEASLPSPNAHYDFIEHLSDERGRGFSIMQQLADGLVVTVVPETTIQTIIESDHRSSRR